MFIKDCPVAPALPADLAVSQYDPVGNNGRRMFLGQGSEMFPYQGLVFCQDAGNKFFPDDLVAGFIEIPAIGFVDKDMGTVRQEPGDEFCLVFDNVPVALFTRFQPFILDI